MARDLTERAGNFGLAWLLLCLAFVAHSVDEALTDFLSYYNATVLTLYGHFSWFPRLDMDVHRWATVLIVTNMVLLSLTPFAYRNARFLRPVAYFFAALLLVNGMGHIFFTVLGHTVPSVSFDGSAPGFYSSPLLLAGSIYLLVRLRRSAIDFPGNDLVDYREK
ncbi:MAG: hypothetical protein NVS9B4_02090 [Candidatus Acidiferrum sp.]